MKTPDDLLDELCYLIFSQINYYLSRRMTPDLTVQTIIEFTPDCLDDLITLGIKGLILDLDDTLRFKGQEISLLNKGWLAMARKRLKVIILSNGYCSKTNKYLQEEGISYIGMAYKPFKKSYQRALKSLDLTPDEVMMIGDDYFSDIYGGKRNNLKTALVLKRKNNT